MLVLSMSKGNDPISPVTGKPLLITGRKATCNLQALHVVGAITVGIELVPIQLCSESSSF